MYDIKDDHNKKNIYIAKKQERIKNETNANRS